MTTQPEALWLADILMSRAAMTTVQRVEAAAELRRLHDLSQRAGDSIEELLARIAALEQALGMVVEALETYGAREVAVYEAIAAARQNLSKKEIA